MPVADRQPEDAEQDRRVRDASPHDVVAGGADHEATTATAPAQREPLDLLALLARARAGTGRRARRRSRRARRAAAGTRGPVKRVAEARLSTPNGFCDLGVVLERSRMRPVGDEGPGDAQRGAPGHRPPARRRAAVRRGTAAGGTSRARGRTASRTRLAYAAPASPSALEPPSAVDPVRRRRRLRAPSAGPQQTPTPQKSQPIALPGWRERPRARRHREDRAMITISDGAWPPNRAPTPAAYERHARRRAAVTDERRQAPGQTPGVARAHRSPARSQSDTCAGCIVSATTASARASARRDRPRRAAACRSARACAGRRSGGGRSGGRRAPGCARRAGRKSAATASVEPAIARFESDGQPPSASCSNRTLPR